MSRARFGLVLLVAVSVTSLGLYYALTVRVRARVTATRSEHMTEYGAPIHFVPLAGASASPESIAPIWSRIFTDMAADEKTQSLARRLFDAPIAFASVAAATSAALEAPPPAGSSAILRIASQDARSHGEDGFVGTLASSRVEVVELPDGDAIFPSVLDQAFTDASQKKIEVPDAHAALMLVIEDWLLRSGAGIVPFIGRDAFSREERVQPTVEAQRADLDRRIEDYARSMRAYRESKKRAR